MSGFATAGIIALAVAFVGVLVASALLISRALRLRRHAQRLAASPCIATIGGIAAAGARVGDAAPRLSSLPLRIETIEKRLAEAAAAGARLGLEVKAIAAVVEDLLEWFVPSLRGCAADGDRGR